MTNYTLINATTESSEDLDGNTHHAIHITFARTCAVVMDEKTLKVSTQDLERMSFTFKSGMPLTEFADFIMSAAKPFSSQDNHKGSKCLIG